MFEVVFFIIENYADKGVCLVENKTEVTAEMQYMGFPKFEVDRALSWLLGLDQVLEATEEGQVTSALGYRHYLPIEEERLGLKGRGFLSYLEQLQILDAKTRELVIDRLMALEPQELDVQVIQWVVLLALSKQPEKKAVLAVFEDLVLTDAFGRVH